MCSSDLPIEIVPVSRLENLFYLPTLPCKRPSRTTFLDPDTRWAIEGVHPKERVTILPFGILEIPIILALLVLFGAPFNCYKTRNVRYCGLASPC